VRVGIIVPAMNFENDGTITNTGGAFPCAEPIGICVGGNHKSHCA
jgi:hypothetical protein